MEGMDGLQDMLSIPRDWCYDWFDIDWYSKSPMTDPIGPPATNAHVVRGAGMYSLPFRVSSAIRTRGGEHRVAELNAIRLCRTITAGPRAVTAAADTDSAP